MLVMHLALVMQLVCRGEGYALLSSAAVVDSMNRKALSRVYLEEGEIKLDVFIAHVKDHYLSFASQAFLDLLMDLIAEDKNLPTIDELKGRLHRHSPKLHPM
jgi:DNA-binding transcriptional LysR family regulator